MARREFLQLAKKFNTDKSKIAGWMLSEKLDGSRCFWDGGISRGMATKDCPYSSLINPKTGEPKGKVKPVATGLWSRYGNPVMAPDWFLDDLPAIPLDGELWAGRGKFQLCRSIVAGDVADPRFDQVKYAVYSMPGARVWQSGEIKNSNFHRHIDYNICLGLVEDHDDVSLVEPESFFDGHTFEGELNILRQYLSDDPEASCYIHKQIKLPEDEAAARAALDSFMDGVMDRGGEGVIIRNPKGLWTPKRVNDLLKYKPIDDDEGILVGFTCGRQTNRGSKHMGRIGALILDYKGKRLELSGLTDAERAFATDEDRHYANEHPGEDMPGDTQGAKFLLGERITFKFRELSDDGIPKEARYFRNRGEVK
jgi:DNA ligase-1